MRLQRSMISGMLQDFEAGEKVEFEFLQQPKNDAARSSYILRTVKKEVENGVRMTLNDLLEELCIKVTAAKDKE